MYNKLYLDNMIGSVGCKLISEQLHLITNLQNLNISGTYAGKGIKYLCNNFRYITNIKKLDISNNYIGNDEFRSIYNLIHILKRLTELHLENNNIDKENVIKIYKKLNLNY